MRASGILFSYFENEIATDKDAIQFKNYKA